MHKCGAPWISVFKCNDILRRRELVTNCCNVIAPGSQQTSRNCTLFSSFFFSLSKWTFGVFDNSNNSHICFPYHSLVFVCISTKIHIYSVNSFGIPFGDPLSGTLFFYFIYIHILYYEEVIWIGHIFCPTHHRLAIFGLLES